MATYVGRSGLFPEHRKHGTAAPRYPGLRLTIPAQEALVAGGNVVAEEAGPHDADSVTYTVTLSGTVPAGLVFAQGMRGTDRGLRLKGEPEYPWEKTDCAAWWDRLAFEPCPKCGAALIWYEAGYAPGYRICHGKRHHHVMPG